MQRKLSIGTVERLIHYYRCVEELIIEGQTCISSEELAEKTGYTPAQVRKDLTWHGALGVPGKGYATDVVQQVLRKLLGKHRPRLVGLVGVGHLGLALLRHPDFHKHGFHIVAGFDKELTKIGHSIDGVYIYDVSQIEKVCPLLKIEMGLVAVPPLEAQKVSDALIRAGVLGILNFAAVRLSVPSHVHLENVDLSIELEKLSCRIEGWL